MRGQMMRLSSSRRESILESTADRALAGEFGQVICLEAPEAVPAPACLLRVDGRSVYQRHGGVRYATHVQLSMEEQLVAQAQAAAAPAMTREQAARVLGASVTMLTEALTRRAPETHAALAHDRLVPGGVPAPPAAAVLARVAATRR